MPDGDSDAPVAGTTLSDLVAVTCDRCGGAFNVAAYVLHRFHLHGCSHCGRPVTVTREGATDA